MVLCDLDDSLFVGRVAGVSTIGSLDRDNNPGFWAKVSPKLPNQL